MTEAPPHLVQTFLALVAALAALFVSAQSRLAGEAPAARLRGLLEGAAVVALWLGASGWLAARGALADFSRAPPPFALLLAAASAATVALACSPLGTRFVERAPIAWLVGYQAFRVPVEHFLREGAAHGLVPLQMTWAGWNFDVASGAGAAALALLAALGRAPRALIALWNAAGFALLAIVVAIGFLSLPTPLRAFPGDPSSAFLARFPFVWLPAFLVQAALFGHVVVWRWLRRARRGAR